ncbi:MAG: hypothetical protein ACFFB5_07215 [Promethearchaeota archaeon]
MQTKSYKILRLPCLIILVMTISFISPASAGEIPVIETKVERTTFIPAGSEGGFLYYVNPPGTDFTDSPILYQGYSGVQNAEYTYFLNYQEFYTGKSNLERDQGVSDGLLSDTIRYGDHPLFDPELYPCAVRIPSIFDPIFEYTQRRAINLHMDHSYTFMVEAYVEYFGFLNTSEAFFLDIDIFDCNAYGSIIFPDAFPTQGYSIGYIEKQMTYPFFPRGNSSKPLNFTFMLDQGSLVTLTPHPWEFPEYMPEIKVNTSYSGEIDQGTRVIIEDNEMIYPENELFSIRMFNLTLEADQYYELFIDFRMLEYSGCTSNQPYVFLIAEYIDVIPYTYLNQNGYRIHANQDESVFLVFFTQGWSVGEYVVYYQNYKQIEELTNTVPLTFNKNIKVNFDIYYSFTLDTPHMIAVNYSYYHDFNLYIPGAHPDEWIQVGTSSFFDPEYGNLFGSIGEIGNNWRYFPAGTYAIRFTYYWSSGEIRFTKVPVQSPGTVSVTKDSIFAFELSLKNNKINFVNISTDDHIIPYQRVQYEYSWIGKYNEMIKNVYYPGNTWIGNRNDTGQWLQWGSNNTLLEAFLPTRNYEIPILMIRPFSAENSAFQFPEPFAATLTVSNNEAPIQHYSSFFWNYIGGGYFIPKNGISRRTFFEVNDDTVANTDHLYGIPLYLERNRIYNITAYLHGNYTTGSSPWNATLDGVSVLGGNLNNLAIFGTMSSGWDETSYWNTMLILTVVSTVYLYVDVTRTFNGTNYRNATLEIYFKEITANYLDFVLPPFEYNATPHTKEVVNDDLLASELTASEMKKPSGVPGFEFILVLGTLVIVVGRISHYRRKR